MSRQGLAILPDWAADLREMFFGIESLELRARKASSLGLVCEYGARYAVHRLERRVSAELLSVINRRGISQLRAYLEQRLGRISKPVFDLGLSAFTSAFDALQRQSNKSIWPLPSAGLAREFLGARPSLRLFQMFKRFPVLARLWLQQICYWCDATEELLVRFETDRADLSRHFFGGAPVGRIIDLEAGLSDPHNHGRTVMLLQVEAGSVIYKPRPGNGEWQWQRLLNWLNVNGFGPRLRTVTVLRRRGYCWMERVESEPCGKRAGACKFFERLGGLICRSLPCRPR